MVDFGQAADEVIPVLEALIGSSPTATGSQAGWVEFVGWDDLGLFVGFDTPAAEGYSGASRFVGWEYFGSDGGTTFVTAEGATIGTALSELRAVYGDRLEVSTALDECVSGTAYPIVLGGSIFGRLDRFPADDARVRTSRPGGGWVLTVEAVSEETVEHRVTDDRAPSRWWGDLGLLASSRPSMLSWEHEVS